LLAASLALHPLLEPDVFWHLAAGRWIVEHGRLPSTDVLTWTMRDHVWTNFQWLFDVALVSAWRAAGADALILGNALVLAAVAALIARGARAAGAGPAAAAFAAALHALAAAERTTVRPEAFSYLALAAVGLLAEEARRGASRRRVLLAPALVALWINIHSLAFLGAVLLALHAIAACLEPAREGGPASRSVARDLAAAAALSAVALLANPWGVAAWTFPLTLFQRVGPGHDVFARILEFAPAWRDPADPALRVFWIAVLLFVLSCAAVPRRIAAGRLVVALPFLALALLARRNVPLFSLVAAPLLAANLAGLARRPGFPGFLARAAAPATAAGIAACMAAILGGASPALLGLPRERGLGIQPGIFPETCLATLDRLGIRGRLFNDLDFGGYVEWRNPDLPAFLDARLEVAGAGRLAEFVAAHESPAGWARLEARWDPEILLLSHASRGSAALLRSLLASGRWTPVCLSPEAALLVSRRVAEVPAARPGAIPWGEILAEPRGAEPGAGRALAALAGPLDRWLREDPSPSAVRRAVRLANLHLTLEDPAAAREGYEAVLVVAPDDAEALFGLGLCALRLGGPGEARRVWEGALARVDRGSRELFRAALADLPRGG
jgi:hypothetical protein